MQRRTLFAAFPAIGLTMATSLRAQPTSEALKVSSGGEKGTYFQLMKEFDAARPGLIQNTVSDGSLTNIDSVVGNKAELGITQLDTLVFRSQKEGNLKDRVRVLAVLHAEEIHFIAKAAGRTEGGYGAMGVSVGGRTVFLNSINDLKGRKVGVWGGAIVTEQILANMALTGWMPVEYSGQKDAVAALQSDQIDAILAVGGQPLVWVGDLSRDYKLLEVPDSVANRLSSVYEKASLTYRNLGQDGIPSLAVRCMLVTQKYKGKAKREALQKLHDQLVGAVDDIRETRGTHPKWSEIDPAATTDRWPMYLTTVK